MKKILFAGGFMLALIAAVAFKPVANDPESLAIGASAPMTTTKMQSTAGKDLSLADIKRGNGLLVVFSCNTCPFVVGAEGYGDGWEGRYMELKKFADANQVGMVLVNSNEGKREKGDNLNDMKARSKEKGFDAIAYVLDENSALANAFGARTTPHVFLFDKNFKLVYKGSIDDNNESPSLVKEHYLKNAIGNMANGKPVPVAETKPVGCSIKRVQK
ncbi:MAG: redoxin family protein [Flavobacteriales bacterium]|jgi:hypothetical protein